MSAYEELVERICPLIVAGSERLTCTEAAWNILAEVLRTLEAVTPEMAFEGIGETSCNRVFRAMLRASPLNPTQEKI